MSKQIYSIISLFSLENINNNIPDIEQGLSGKNHEFKKDEGNDKSLVIVRETRNAVE